MDFLGTAWAAAPADLLRQDPGETGEDHPHEAADRRRVSTPGGASRAQLSNALRDSQLMTPWRLTMAKRRAGRGSGCPTALHCTV